jgi:hypothetical protein
MTDVFKGQWVLMSDTYGGKLNPDIAQVEKVTAKRIVAKIYNYPRHYDRTNLLAAFDNREDAKRLRQSLNGVLGEQNSRIAAAREAAEKQADELIAKALAQGIVTEGEDAPAASGAERLEPGSRSECAHPSSEDAA